MKALRPDDADLHVAADGTKATDITFRYVFRNLDPDDEADFLMALRPVAVEAGEEPRFEAHFAVRYEITGAGRLRPRRWCGTVKTTP